MPNVITLSVIMLSVMAPMNVAQSVTVKSKSKQLNIWRCNIWSTYSFIKAHKIKQLLYDYYA